MNEEDCKLNEYWDNGYLRGYYCQITGNKCDKDCCPMYELENDNDE